MFHDEPFPGRGRQPKDAALVLRDRYWALHLKSKLPAESYASLERKLMSHLRIGRRENGEGYSQPFALSKTSRGTRGLSCSIDEVNSIVFRADQLVPGSLAAYTSILWFALASKPSTHRHDGKLPVVVREVWDRLSERHFKDKDALQLNLHGIRRVSRIRHLDALGLLLNQCKSANETTRESLAAEVYVIHLLLRSCRHDPALEALKVELVALVKERHLGELAREVGETAKLFLAPKLTDPDLALRRAEGRRFRSFQGVV